MKNNIFDTLDKDWKNFIGYNENTEYFYELGLRINKEYENNTVYPSYENLLNCFHLTRVDELKAVILGQDPYHNKGEANGMSFSVNRGVRMPPSLRNIFKEIYLEYGYENIDTDLSPWAKQGVLLLNTVLMVKENEPLSYKDFGFEKLIYSVIDGINRKKENVVFFLWGGNARAYKKIIDSKKHLILEAPHPSPLSSYRGFFGCNHFKRANEYFVEKNIDIIDWKI